MMQEKSKEKFAIQELKYGIKKDKLNFDQRCPKQFEKEQEKTKPKCN